ncbi:integrase [Rhodobacteraceae bacterium RKSG542]|uniref:DUF6460 domain-containing protein n=1 Tax=Pseudovibrio flavus TaxID=2529854 RepID=UPI0012BCB27A|nr:DUF6460 domain-containing protein [Pseudovibrio flavus]MTI18800.1 integrase [Pseudovibrio flavus]
MDKNQLNRFLGGSPGRVALRLLFLSFIVGIILSALNLYPIDLLYGIRDFVMRIWHMGFDAIERLGSYFLLGAVIVVPIWLLSRILQARRD